jgi:hypothetical protein
MPCKAAVKSPLATATTSSSPDSENGGGTLKFTYLSENNVEKSAWRLGCRFAPVTIPLPAG